jgi:hypothetical protein
MAYLHLVYRLFSVILTMHIRIKHIHSSNDSLFRVGDEDPTWVEFSIIVFSLLSTFPVLVVGPVMFKNSTMKSILQI